ncbi:hypothetical protein HMPREF2884_01445 [Rothia sp. HMSC073B08]|nr:hypothetical protein HMPREF2884_01445 [Rothia sp. HMSC073B08]
MQDTLCVGALTVVCAALTTVLALTTALAHQSLLIVFMDARPTFGGARSLLPALAEAVTEKRWPTL